MGDKHGDRGIVSIGLLCLASPVIGNTAAVIMMLIVIAVTVALILR